jgi:hypothetical protein
MVVVSQVIVPAPNLSQVFGEDGAVKRRAGFQPGRRIMDRPRSVPQKAHKTLV